MTLKKATIFEGFQAMRTNLSYATFVRGETRYLNLSIQRSTLIYKTELKEYR